MVLLNFIVALTVLFFSVPDAKARVDENEILVVMTVANREFTLPYFFAFFDKLSFPKDKLSLFIRSDHNTDNTTVVLFSWLKKNSNKYKSCDVKMESSSKAYTEITSKDLNLMRLKEEGLNTARQVGVDYVLFLDTDVFLTDKDVLQKMIKEEKVIVSPLLTSTTLFSNFWGAMTESFWYKRSEDYVDIITRQKIGCFPVALVSDCILLDLNNRQSKYLSFQQKNLPKYQSRDVPVVDIIAFSLIAKSKSIKSYICNKEEYGFVLQVADPNGNEKDLEQIKILGLEHVTRTKKSYKRYLNGSDVDAVPVNMGFNKVYCINLVRRVERRKAMEDTFRKQGLQPTFIDALDWMDTNSSYYLSNNYKIVNPYKLGLLCNFISHHKLYKEIVDKNYKMVLIFEDDAQLHDDFRERLNSLMAEVERLNLVFDVIFLERWPMRPNEDHKVFGSDLLTKNSYSLSMMAYILSLNGAKKMIRDEDILSKMLPIDEYVAVRYGRHPSEEWASIYKYQDIIAYAANTYLVTGTHAWGDEGSYSDTHHSVTLDQLIALEHKEYGMKDVEF